MSQSNKPIQKTNLHPRNKHNHGYDFALLIEKYPPLSQYIIRVNDRKSIDFSNPLAVTSLNTALLNTYYAVDFWQIPSTYLCPAIPGRVDYIHYLADLLKHSNEGTLPKGKQVSLLDIGTGAGCIYPILAQKEYGWRCLGSDIDPISVATAQEIIKANKRISKQIKVVLQKSAQQYFKSVVKNDDRFDLTMCNPPFHRSLEDALHGNQRKRDNLNKNKPPTKTTAAKLNFGGQQAELFCQGGELAFIKSMAVESQLYALQILWFTSLISKSAHVKPIRQHLEKLGAIDIKVIKMAQGHKISRFICWTFQTTAQQTLWRQERWGNQE